MKELHIFLGQVNFYKRCPAGIANIILPLINVLKGSKLANEAPEWS
jgi:hypothetical protein